MARPFNHGISRHRLHSILNSLLLPTLVLASLLASALASCSPEDPYVPTAPIDTVRRVNGAFLRVINAAADNPRADVLVDGKKFFALPQGYLDFSETNNNARYYPVDSNAAAIVFKAPGGAEIAGGALRLKARQYYTAYLHGNATRGYRVLVTSDSIELSTVPGKSVKYRVVNLAPDSPPIDIKQDSANTSPVVTDLGYGQASAYVASKEYLPRGTGLWIYDHATGTEIRAVTPPYIVLPPNATFTLVLTGNAQPRGDDAFLNFSAFQESYLSTADSLRGSPPININFCAARFVNAVASGDSLLDVTFYDPSNEFRENENFRRNLVGQPQTMEGVASLGLAGQPTHRHYFYISMLIRQEFPYRVEYHQTWRPATTGDPVVYRRQDAFLGRVEFKPAVNKRYTIVAYGPYNKDSARTALLVDNTPAPPAGMVQVRFFNAAFGAAYQGKRLRLRINGGTTPTPTLYGEVPAALNSFTTSPGSPTAEVLDETGAVIHTQTLDATPLKADKAYTLFLTRGAFGNTLYLHALAEDFTP